MAAGAAAGIVMAGAMMVYMAWADRSIWTMPNLIAAMWLGPDAVDSGFSRSTVVGFTTHMATSPAMGVIALPFIDRLPPRRTILAALSYSLASYPVAFATVMTWANPVMVERAGVVPMTGAHAVFGVVLGLVYLRLRRPTVADGEAGASR